MEMLKNLYQKFKIQTAFERRRPMLESMHTDEANGLSCKDCVGHCCTMVSNSMKIDLLQTLEIYSELLEKGLWTVELKTRLQDCITQFRLDKEMVLSRGQEFRRTYTCPFYLGHKLGCDLDPKIKPYGCLGFNPDKTRVVEWGDCSSRQNLLEQREKENKNEQDAIDFLSHELQLPLDKKPIPVALLNLERALMKRDDLGL